jgi:hypothetical protein
MRLGLVSTIALYVIALTPGNESAAATPDSTLQVQGEGDAPGRGQEARRNAVTNARNRLLINHLETWSDSPKLSRLAPILDRGATYFRNVRVVRHEPDEESTHVEIQADLLVSKIRDDIAKFILPALDRKPTVVVIMQDDFGEDDIRGMNAPGVAEKMVRKLMRDAGFKVIDSDRLRSKMTPEALVTCVAGAESLPAEAARSLFADVTIVGRATTSLAADGRRTNLHRNRGSVALRIVRAEDDAIVEELRSTSVVESKEQGVGGAMAVEDACEKLADALTSGVIMAVLFSPADDTIKISMLGQPADGSRDDVVKWLAGQENVDAVEIMGRDESLIRLRLEYRGSLGDLVDLLEDSAAVRITQVLGQSVTAEFMPHGGGDLAP